MWEQDCMKYFHIFWTCVTLYSIWNSFEKVEDYFILICLDEFLKYLSLSWCNESQYENPTLSCMTLKHQVDWAIKFLQKNWRTFQLHIQCWEDDTLVFFCKTIFKNSAWKYIWIHWKSNFWNMRAHCVFLSTTEVSASLEIFSWTAYILIFR